MTKFVPPPRKEVEYELLPAGNYIARCIGWIDLGDQTKQFATGEKIERTLKLSFEIPDEMKEIKDPKTGGNTKVPAIVSRDFNFTYHEKSNLRFIYDSWFGKKHSEDEIEKLNPVDDILGKTALINICHQESKSTGYSYLKINAITPLMKGMECPEQITPSTYFFMGWKFREVDFDDETYLKLPDFIKNKIVLSPQYKRVKEADSQPKEESYDEKIKREAEEAFGS